MSDTLADFARVNDAVAAVPGKLAKQKLLAGYFASIESDQTLRQAVRYAAGRAFSATDQRVLGVSGAIVLDAVKAVWNPDPLAFRAAMIRHGEIGEPVAELASRAGATSGDRTLMLTDLAETFDRLAETSLPQHKRDLLTDLLRRIADPREAAYLVKVILSDLRTGVKEGVLQSAVAQAFDATVEAIRRALALLGDLEDVAVLARHGRLEEARLTPMRPVQFMLATPRDSPEALVEAMGNRTFLAEDKLDGIRAQVHRLAGRVAIYSRTMDRVEARFPEIVSTAGSAEGDFVLDGEIVAVDVAGSIRPFAHLQPRLGRKDVSPGILRRWPVAFVAFDLLYRDGESWLDRPLSERREGLEKLSPPFAVLAQTPVSSTGQIASAFAQARDRDNEGLVLKDPQSTYSPGRRGRFWFKLKTHLPTLDCVVTAAEYGHGKRRGTLSDYTFAVWDRDPDDPDASLVNIGKAYSGVTDDEIAKLTELFKSISTADNGRVFQVPPRVVLEIAMDQVQRSTRHASGYSLRFPRIKRIRWDKRPEDADRIGRVRELFASKANVTKKDHPPPEPGLFDQL